MLGNAQNWDSEYVCPAFDRCDKSSFLRGTIKKYDVV